MVHLLVRLHLWIGFQGSNMMRVLLCLAVVIPATFCIAADNKKEKRGLLNYGTLGGYGFGGTLGYRGGTYDSHIPLPVPYQAEAFAHPPVHIGTNVHTTITRKFAVPVPHPVPVPVERQVAVPVPHPVPYAVPKPYPVAVPKPYAVPVDRPYPVPVDRPYAVPYPHPVAVPVDKPVAVPVPAPYPVGVPKPYAVGIPHPYPVPYAVSHGFPQFAVRPHIRNEGLGLGLGSSIIH